MTAPVPVDDDLIRAFVTKLAKDSDVKTPLKEGANIEWLVEQIGQRYLVTLTASDDAGSKQMALRFEQAIQLANRYSKTFQSGAGNSLTIPMFRLAIYLIRNQKTLPQDRLPLKKLPLFTQKPLLHTTLSDPVHQEFVITSAAEKLNALGISLPFLTLTHGAIQNMTSA